MFKEIRFIIAEFFIGIALKKMPMSEGKIQLAKFIKKYIITVLGDEQTIS